MMSDKKETVTFSDILVALDSSRHSRAALESAALIAKLLEANLCGLFVHDAQWLRISRLPTAFEINEVTGEITPIAQDSIKEQIQKLEKQIKDHFEQISEEFQLPHSWKSVHGGVKEKVFEAAKEADLITIGRIGRSFYKTGKLGSTARAVIQELDKPVLILQEGIELKDKIVAVYDGTSQSKTGVNLAAVLAKKNQDKLVIIDLTHGTPDEADAEKELDQLLSYATLDLEILTLKEPNIGKFLFLLNRLKGGLLVIPKTERYTKYTNLERILEAVISPVLLMT